MITKVFSLEKIFQQHFLLGHKIGLHFPEYELAIVINECESSTLDTNHEAEKQEAISDNLVCGLTRIDINAKDYD